MDFSNRHTNEFVNLCDLERVLGGVFACHEEVKGSCVNTAVVNGVNVAIFDCTGGNAGRIADSELLLRKSLKNIVIPDSDPKSEICACANTNANSPRHICESKLGRGDFLVRVGEYLKKSVRAQIEVNPQPSYAHLLPSLGEGKTSHADTKGITNLVGWGFHPNNDGGVK